MFAPLENTPVPPSPLPSAPAGAPGLPGSALAADTVARKDQGEGGRIPCPSPDQRQSLRRRGSLWSRPRRLSSNSTLHGGPHPEKRPVAGAARAPLARDGAATVPRWRTATAHDHQDICHATLS